MQPKNPRAARSAPLTTYCALGRCQGRSRSRGSCCCRSWADALDTSDRPLAVSAARATLQPSAEAALPGTSGLPHVWGMIIPESPKQVHTLPQGQGLSRAAAERLHDLAPQGYVRSRRIMLPNHFALACIRLLHRGLCAFNVTLTAVAATMMVIRRLCPLHRKIHRVVNVVVRVS